jgi:hypothetical protein
MKRFLGSGKSWMFQKDLKEGETCLEEGNMVYAVVEEEFFCPECDGCGCKSCKHTGERETFDKLKKKHRI